MRVAAIPAFFLLAASLVAHGEAAGADPERGRTLYETRCDGCHAQSVHGRDKRVAGDFDSIRQWVRRWSVNQGLQWSDDEVRDVAAWLNVRYYRFACPPPDCKPTARSAGPDQSVASR
jgi:mono/diheme cytochrome c family protein